jgi:hypothetical protein
MYVDSVFYLFVPEHIGTVKWLAGSKTLVRGRRRRVLVLVASRDKRRVSAAALRYASGAAAAPTAPPLGCCLLPAALQKVGRVKKADSHAFREKGEGKAASQPATTLPQQSTAKLAPRCALPLRFSSSHQQSRPRRDAAGAAPFLFLLPQKSIPLPTRSIRRRSSSSRPLFPKQDT